ncbi:MAG: apolipoprotein N-acyltransferase [Limisphaerales bacterium]
MKRLSIEPGVAGRYGLAATAGVVASLGFAPAQLDGAAWVGPGMILFCALGWRGARAFRVGFTAGLAHFLASLYWLLAMPFTWHGFPLAPALAWVALSAYCAAYFGLWVWFCWRVFPTEETAGDSSLIEVIDQFLLTSAWQRITWAFLCAASWTALEFARGRVLGGFPWNFLAVSQYRLIPVTQIASVTGVYGVSFLMVWFSVALLAAMLGLARQPSTQRIWSDVALPLLAVTWVTGYGMTKIAHIGSAGRTIRVALVQPSIPQTLIFDPNADEARFRQLLDLSDQALAAEPADLLLWPESAVPNLSPENQQAIGHFVARHHVWLIFCTDLTERQASGANALYNSGVVISPKGEVQAVYHKRRLVIFGEYVPLRKWLPFLKWLTPEMEDYTPGDRPVAFKLSHPDATTSVLICFEDMFPGEAREHAGLDTDFLINLTNDGWFGEGPEQMQQAASAVFRAVENGMPLVRCANNGLTCWVDAQGRMRQIEEKGGSIYGRGSMTITIPLAGPGEHPQTIYNRYGDWFGWICCGLSLGALFLRRRSQDVPIGA